MNSRDEILDFLNQKDLDAPLTKKEAKELLMLVTKELVRRG